MKPAELTSLSALRIGELALEAGLPPGVLNIVTGPGRVVGDALVNHPDVDKVTFTGSPGVGRGIMRGAAGNFKRVSLELGGKSANVIFDDADLERLRKPAASGIFFNAGQVCSAGSRVLVQEKAYDEVVERLAARAKSLKMGDTLDRKTALGPVISEKQMKSILDYVDIGRQEGGVPRHRRRRGSASAATSSALRCSRMSSTRCGYHRRKSSAPSSASSSSGRGRCLADRQRHRLQPRCRRLEPRHRPRAAFCQARKGRHGVDQHLRLYRCETAVGRRARFRPRPGAWHRGNRQFHRTESGLDEPERLTARNAVEPGAD
jgi:hypothetical protein